MFATRRAGYAVSWGCPAIVRRAFEVDDRSTRETRGSTAELEDRSVEHEIRGVRCYHDSDVTWETGERCPKRDQEVWVSGEHGDDHVDPSETLNPAEPIGAWSLHLTGAFFGHACHMQCMGTCCGLSLRQQVRSRHYKWSSFRA